jgi:hypothetical protein
MKDFERIRFAMCHVQENSVVVFEREQWYRLIRATGEPTRLEYPPEPIAGVMNEAVVVAVAGSGQENPNPGLDIVRRDAKDDPYIYNKDHYPVVEDLPSLPRYKDFLSIARVTDSEGLRTALRDHVFIVGPEKGEGHWVEEVPEQIRNAKPK